MIDMEELNTYLTGCGPETKLYLGCDSRVFYKRGKRMAKYTSVIVVHIDGCRGGKIFHESAVEKDYCPQRRKPNMRLMNEVQKVSALYLRMLDEAENALLLEIEVHLDINPEKEHRSNEVINEAIGYVRGVCQEEPKVKPEAWAASAVADRG